MKIKYVVTKNVKKFESAIQRINHKLHGVERIAVVTGEVGLGKTIAAIHFGAFSGATILTIWPRMTQHWLLREIVKELGAEPAWRTERLVEQVREELIKKPRVIIFDEVDHLFRDGDIKRIDALETLRKIHDICYCPLIFVGEEWINKKIERIPRLYDRVVETVKFEKLGESDVKDMISQLSEYRFNDDAIEKITKISNGRIRPVMRLIHAAEGAGRIHQLKSITARDIR